MSNLSPGNRSTKVSQVIQAPRPAVYRAFIDPHAVASWLAPDRMRGRVETFEAYEGGKFRMSLTYLDAADSQRGKTSGDTDTFQGRFAELVPNERIVWVVEFESNQPDMAGEMTITWSLVDAAEGTNVTVHFDNLPTGVSLADNELGSRQTLRKLARYVEGAASS